MGQAAIDALVHLLETGNERERRAAARCLGSYDRKYRAGAETALRRAAAGDPSEAVRKRAAKALGIAEEEESER
jgi:HEAT repeat protein